MPITCTCLVLSGVCRIRVTGFGVVQDLAAAPKTINPSTAHHNRNQGYGPLLLRIRKFHSKSSKSVRYRRYFQLKTCPRIRKGIHLWGSPCTTQKVKQATLVFILSMTTTLHDHICLATASKWLLACPWGFQILTVHLLDSNFFCAHFP